MMRARRVGVGLIGHRGDELERQRLSVACITGENDKGETRMDKSSKGDDVGEGGDRQV